jgi:DHA1 family bicyclomycin/chloramphenicol resistance-like MFS transporter
MPPTSHAPAKTAAAKAMSPGLIVLLLSLLLGLQPVTTDLYLPALPALTEGFGASMAQAQLTLTALLLSFGLSQLIWGPLSDRFGRRPVLLWGMVAYVAASVGSALAASMELLIVWRTVQGAAMGAGVMAARAVVRDLYQPVDAARAMSKGLSGLGVIACTSAPLGGLLSDLFGWRATLLGVAVFGAAALALIALRFEETVPPANRRAHAPGLMLAKNLGLRSCAIRPFWRSRHCRQPRTAGCSPFWQPRPSSSSRCWA